MADLSQLLLQAIQEENLHLISSALEQSGNTDGISVDVLSQGLVEAAKSGKLRSADFLLRIGASSNYNNSEALHYADNLGHILLVNRLLEEGADPEATISGALESAARNNEVGNFQALQKHFNPHAVNLGLKTGTRFNADGSIAVLPPLRKSAEIDVFSIQPTLAGVNEATSALFAALEQSRTFTSPSSTSDPTSDISSASSLPDNTEEVLPNIKLTSTTEKTPEFWEKSIQETMMAHAQPLPGALKNATAEDTKDPLEGLTKQGFRVIKNSPDDIPGREDEVERTLGLLGKGKSVLITGRAGSGKSTLAHSLGEKLAREDKILMEVPVGAFRSSDSYVEGAHRAVKAWFGAYDALPAELQRKIVFFVDEAQQLVGNSDGGLADSPIGFLKTRLDPKHPHRMVLLGATTSKNYEEINDRDESFARYFTQVGLEPMSADNAIDGLCRAVSLEDMKIQGLDFGNEAQLRGLLSELSTLADQFIPNQDFPRKLADLTQEMLAQKPAAAWNEEGEIAIQNGFCKVRQIPNSMVLNKTPVDSPYLTITTDLGQDVLGQEPSTTKISGLALASICRQGGTHAPKSAMLMGPTGVGKTETAESLARRLGVPFLKLHMGSQTNQNDAKQLLEDLAYFAENNYAGLILLDELEKADPKSFEALLGFLDKGEISGGKNGMVKTGNMIVLMTTNAGADILHEVGDVMQEKFQTRDVTESVCREILKGYGFAPEFVGRIDSIAEYHPLSHEVALKLATREMNKQQRIMQNGRGIELDMSEALLSQMAARGLVLNEGGRGIQRVVKEMLSKAITLPGIVQNLDQGATLQLGVNAQEEMTVSLTNRDNVSITINGAAHKSAEQEARHIFQAILDKRRAEGRISPTLSTRRNGP